MPRPSPKAQPAPVARAYHHGDLRSALIGHARAILHDAGLEALTLRAVARAAGVSQTAPYRHFADRRALMGAVAAEGFRELHGAMGAAMASDAGRQGFRGVATAYVDFATANASLYRVMFGPEVANTADLPELAESARGALGFVQAGLHALQTAGLVKTGDTALMAVATWASLHGLALLILDGQAESVASDLDQLVEATAQLVMLGLAPRS